MRGALYVRLTPDDVEGLLQMAADEHRNLHSQAAHLISEGLARWRLQREFIAGLPPDADDDIEAGVA